MIPTLQDVARRANVSTATVSRCLNAPAKVVPATRKRVLQAVEELGYSPNFGARALASRRTGTFGAVVPTMLNAIFAHVLQAFEEEIGRGGATLLMASSSYSPAKEAEQIRALVARGADGLLLIGAHRDEDIYRFLDRRKIPYVLAWTYSDRKDRVFVGYDNVGAMREMTARVLDLGHRRLAMIAGVTCDNDRARDRVAGLRRGVADFTGSGGPPVSVELLERPYTIDDGAEAFTQLMRDRPADTRPTAVLCGNDVLAIGALQRAADMGLRVPGDVSITGFDDNEMASITRPGLATVHFSQAEMGHASARALLHHLAQGTPASSVRLPTRIIERQSLGPAPV